MKPSTDTLWKAAKQLSWLHYVLDELPVMCLTDAEILAFDAEYHRCEMVLEKKGLVEKRTDAERTCTVTGYKAATWWPTKEAILGRLG